MADGKKLFLNNMTGEVISRRSRLSAWWYFKADGIKCGYKVRWSDIIRWR